jgi:hypothetical protein
MLISKENLSLVHVADSAQAKKENLGFIKIHEQRAVVTNSYSLYLSRMPDCIHDSSNTLPTSFDIPISAIKKIQRNIPKFAEVAELAAKDRKIEAATYDKDTVDTVSFNHTNKSYPNYSSIIENYDKSKEESGTVKVTLQVSELELLLKIAKGHKLEHLTFELINDPKSRYPVKVTSKDDDLTAYIMPYQP